MEAIADAQRFARSLPDRTKITADPYQQLLWRRSVTAEILAVLPLSAFDGISETDPPFRSRAAVREQTRFHC